MKYFPIFMLILVCTSCNLFETKKISTEEFYDQELKSIEWDQVDQYPSFAACDHLTDKQAQKSCFENTLLKQLNNTIAIKDLVSADNLNDTVIVRFSVSNDGKLVVKELTLDSLVRKTIPDLENWITEGLINTQPLSPAYKRGVPVRSEFTLPVIIKTSNL